MADSIQDFESALAELESIVTKLEQGDLPLKQSLGLFERGVQLSRFCHGKLEDAERRIEILTERGEVRQAPASLADPDRNESPARTPRPGRDRDEHAAHADDDSPRGLARRAARRCGSGVGAGARAACGHRRVHWPAVVHEAMRYSLLAGGKRLPDADARRGGSGRGTQKRRPSAASEQRFERSRRSRRRRDAGDDAGAAHAGAPPRATGGVRDRDDSHLLADPRRSTSDGRRLAAPRIADVARAVRRGDGDPRGRRPADRSLHAARARTGRRHRRKWACASSARSNSSRKPPARRAWSAARRSICTRPVLTPIKIRLLRSRHSMPPRCATCTRAKPAR